MVRKAQNSNKQFLWGTASLAFGVLCIVFIFVTLCYDKMKHSGEEHKFDDIYQIELVKGFAGDSAIIYINDSLLWQGVVNLDTFTLSIDRFAEQNMLMISTGQNDIASSFNLENKGGRLVLRRQNAIISLTTLEW